MAYCVNCGIEIKEEYEYCPECGIAITDEKNLFSKFAEENYKFCKLCGEKMPEDAFYCLACGATFDLQDYDFESIKHSVISKSNSRKIDTSVGVWKNKWVALILCIFLGIFGMHRFYEGKKVTGLIYFFTFGLLGIGWLFDLILIATKTNPYRVK